jgi:hypothetical protein
MVATEELRAKLLSLPREVLVVKYLQAQELKSRLDSKYALNKKKYYYDCLGWVEKFVNIDLDGKRRKGKGYLRRALGKVHGTNDKIAIHAVHGAGKTVFDALVLLWAGAVSDDCKVITTASVWRQLSDYLWPEIHKWYHRTDWEAFGHRPELLDMSVTFGPASFATAASPAQAESIEGAHAVRVVYINDEAKAIIASVWESQEGAFSTEGDHLHVATSTPGDCSGVYYNICSRAAGYEDWQVEHFSLRDAIRAGRVSLSWARKKRAAWGPTNPVYINRVWGLFASNDPSSIIPLSWVMVAVNRWIRWQADGGKFEGDPDSIGADTAGQGVDKTVFYKRYGLKLDSAIRYGKSRPMELAGKLKILATGTSIVNIDTSFGEGAGTADRLEEFEEFKGRVSHVNFGEKTDRKDKSGDLGFNNVRTAMWWGVRELLDPENKNEVMLPNDPMLIGDLVAVRYTTRSDGVIMAEPKDDVKKRIGRSPDDGDACCLAFWKTIKKPIQIFL